MHFNDFVFKGLCGQTIEIIQTHNEKLDDSLVVEVGLTGDVSGYIILVFPFIFIENIINSMMGYIPKSMSELEMSALFETSNIICGNICTQISKEKDILCDIHAPHETKRPAVRPDETIAFDTGVGIFEVDIVVSYR